MSGSEEEDEVAGIGEEASIGEVSEAVAYLSTHGPTYAVGSCPCLSVRVCVRACVSVWVCGGGDGVGRARISFFYW